MPAEIKRGKIKRGQIIPVGKRFSPTYQPTGKAKGEGRAKKRKGQELVQAILDMYFKGRDNQKLRKAAAEYFDVPENDIAVETMMVFKQIERAIEKGDTNAFTAIMDRAFGKPAQPTELTINKGFYDFLKETSASTRKRIQ